MQKHEEMSMKKLIVTVAMALGGTSALAYDSSVDPQEYYPGWRATSPTVQTQLAKPVESDNDLASVLADEGIHHFVDFETTNMDPPMGDPVIGNSVEDFLNREGIYFYL
jgi:hypothetical protein